MRWVRAMFHLSRTVYVLAWFKCFAGMLIIIGMFFLSGDAPVAAVNVRVLYTSHDCFLHIRLRTQACRPTMTRHAQHCTTVPAHTLAREK